MILTEANLAEKHILTAEESLKGAKTPSIYKSLANTLKKRKKCSHRCFYFEKCPLMSMSMSSPERKCMMKQFPERIRSRFKKVFLEGEEGMLDEIKTAIYNYGLSADALPGLREKKEYIDLLLRLHKATYGDKSQIVSDREPLTINIQQLQQTGDKRGITEIPDGTIKPLVQAVESKRSIEYKEKIMEECKEEADTESDPESLFLSENLDSIVRNGK
jgi:hypothetical protein